MKPQNILPKDGLAEYYGKVFNDIDTQEYYVNLLEKIIGNPMW